MKFLQTPVEENKTVKVTKRFEVLIANMTGIFLLSSNFILIPAKIFVRMYKNGNPLDVAHLRVLDNIQPVS